jgi:glycine/D-amino acid oxidase-like deaminating enzyme
MDETLGEPVSFWFDSIGNERRPERTETQPPEALDVCIVGGGLTGLWTAFYLKKADPDLSIAVLEKHHVGFGASGRNGGWCSALFPRSASSLEREHGFDAAVRMRRAMIETVVEVGQVIREEGIDCDFVMGGTVAYARTPAQLAAARKEVQEAERFGVDRLELVNDDGNNGATFTGVAGARGASFNPDCASLQPAKLVTGLALAVEALGVRIYEQAEVLAWTPRHVDYRCRVPGASTRQGSIAASTVVIATEGYGAQLPGVRRRILPLYSLMIATEPLADEFWDSVGIQHGQTFTDYRHLLVYGQRTADNRIAFGGRGARYHWGSSIQPRYDQVDRVFRHLRRSLTELFPGQADAAITHRWGGPIGVARDWHASASFNPKTGVAFAGGYVGDGLSTTNLAGRTLADLITGQPSALTRLPWVNHRSPHWEPEPLRFLGANAGLLGMTLADTEERVTGRKSVAATLLAPLVGH